MKHCSSKSGLHVTFTGKDGYTREEFLSEIHLLVAEFIGENWNLLGMVVNEIVKNIWDHADAKGTLKIERRNDEEFWLQIEDDSSLEYDFSSLVGKSRLTGNGINHGYGLSMISDMGKMLCADFRIDTKSGFKYSGTFEIGVVHDLSEC